MNANPDIKNATAIAATGQPRAAAAVQVKISPQGSTSTIRIRRSAKR
jgi:hypothetical protein